MNETMEEIRKDFSAYKAFIQDYEYRAKTASKYVKCLFINAYNHLLSSYLLSQEGLKTQCFNSLRMGLESEWIGICLDKDIKLAMHWAFGNGRDKSMHKKLLDLEKPSALRKVLGDTKRIKIKDRNDIYKALSDASHTKLASIAIYADKVECIPIGGLRGKVNIKKILESVQFVQEFALVEIEEQLEYKFSVTEWNFNHINLMHISNSGYSYGNGNVEPVISSQGHPGSDPIQALALLDMIRKSGIE